MEPCQQQAQQGAEDAQKPEKVSFDQIRQVQNAIERCMQLYMQPEEVFAFLKNQAKIEPMFSMLVWAKLEEQNVCFFRQYHLRVKIKEQIMQFNQLLEKQAMMLQNMQQQWMQNVSTTTQQQQQQQLTTPAWPVSQASTALGVAASIPPIMSVASQSPATFLIPQAPSSQQHHQQYSQQQQQQQPQQHFGLQSLPQVLAARSAAAAAGPAGYGFMHGSLPHALMPDPAVLAAAAAAAMAAATGPQHPAAVRARLPMSATTTSTAGTAGCTANTAATGAGSASHDHAAADRCFSPTDMIAAWGLGSTTSSGAAGQQQTPTAAAGQAAAATAAAGEAAAVAAEARIERAGDHQQHQQQQGAGYNHNPATGSARDAAYTAAMPSTQSAAAAAADEELAAMTDAATAAGHSGYLTGLSSNCDMMPTESAAEQMVMPQMTKPFSMSDLNALDIPEQLTGVMPGGDLGDYCGMSMGMT